MATTLKYPSPMIPENICAVTFNSLLTKVAILFISYFAPISEMIHVMLIFLLFDTVSGIWASIKEGNAIESHKLRKTVLKFLWYTVAVMAAWMMEHTFDLTWVRLASLTAGFICFVELKSMFENITRITNEPIFKRILKLLKRKSTETISEITDDPEDDYTRRYEKSTKTEVEYTVKHQKSEKNG
ncbi:MAG: phage holin family protein [Bacteroidota bacterium]